MCPALPTVDWEAEAVQCCLLWHRAELCAECASCAVRFVLSALGRPLIASSGRLASQVLAQYWRMRLPDAVCIGGLHRVNLYIACLASLTLTWLVPLVPVLTVRVSLSCTTAESCTPHCRGRSATLRRRHRRRRRCPCCCRSHLLGPRAFGHSPSPRILTGALAVMRVLLPCRWPCAAAARVLDTDRCAAHYGLSCALGCNCRSGLSVQLSAASEGVRTQHDAKDVDRCATCGWLSCGGLCAVLAGWLHRQLRQRALRQLCIFGLHITQRQLYRCKVHAGLGWLHSLEGGSATCKPLPMAGPAARKCLT
jgi:hypothetical protein